MLLKSNAESSHGSFLHYLWAAWRCNLFSKDWADYIRLHVFWEAASATESLTVYSNQIYKSLKPCKSKLWHFVSIEHECKNMPVTKPTFTRSNLCVIICKLMITVLFYSYSMFSSLVWLVTVCKFCLFTVLGWQYRHCAIKVPCKVLKMTCNNLFPLHDQSSR